MSTAIAHTSWLPVHRWWLALAGAALSLPAQASFGGCLSVSGPMMFAAAFATGLVFGLVPAVTEWARAGHEPGLTGFVVAALVLLVVGLVPWGWVSRESGAGMPAAVVAVIAWGICAALVRRGLPMSRRMSTGIVSIAAIAVGMLQGQSLAPLDHCNDIDATAGLGFALGTLPAWWVAVRTAKPCP